GDIQRRSRLTRQSRCQHQPFTLTVPSRFLLPLLPIDAVTGRRDGAVKSLSCIGLAIKAQLRDARLRHPALRGPVAPLCANLEPFPIAALAQSNRQRIVT